jgi:hypothetical protein
VLVIVLLALFLLTSLGISYVALTHGDRQRADDPIAGSQALGNAQAGIREVLTRMSVPGGAEYIGQMPGSYTPGWGRYVVNTPGGSGSDPQFDVPATDGLDNDGDRAVDEAGEHYPETGSRQISLVGQARLDYPWVKVRYKLNATNQVILFGDHDNDPTTPPRENLTQGVPKIIVTAAGRSGSVTRIVTVEAVKWPPPPVPGAVYVEGAVMFLGEEFQINGHDHGASFPTDSIPGADSFAGVATPNDPNAIASELSPLQLGCVRGAGAEPSVGASSVNLDLQAMSEAWSQFANVTLDGEAKNPDMAAWGSLGKLRIVHVKGNLTITGSGSGAGILLVDGNLEWVGAAHWAGLILCMKDAKLHGIGDTPMLLGSILIQGTTSGRSEIAGDTKILYSSAMIHQLAALTGYEVSSWLDQ